MLNPIKVWRSLDELGIQPNIGHLVHSSHPTKRCALGWLWGESMPGESMSAKKVYDGHGLIYNSSTGLFGEGACPISGCFHRISVVHLNDHHKMSFGEIADFVEAYPELILTPDAIKEFGLQPSSVS